MIRLIVDSGASIKPEEKEEYKIDHIIPIRVMLGDDDYLDGVNLDNDVFYDRIINDKIMPKTSLPPLVDVEDVVTEYTNAGDDVIIITMASGISGTYNALRLTFEDNPKVHVVDSITAVGGIRILVNEVNKVRDTMSVEDIVKMLNELKERVVIYAIPETLTYLHRGGRLSKVEYLLGSVIGIKPIIGIAENKVRMLGKGIGLVRTMKKISEDVMKDFDPAYPVVAEYTYRDDNLEKLIKKTDESFTNNIIAHDNLSYAIAAHWGPNAFGFVYIKKA
ncbi:MAG: DegV family protein [Acholeplasmatales bacterium]|nr:DegV family protein [Acholeplasmatales bacterium]